VFHEGGRGKCLKCDRCVKFTELLTYEEIMEVRRRDPLIEAIVQDRAERIRQHLLLLPGGFKITQTQSSKDETKS
jgi:hypothetical protein